MSDTCVTDVHRVGVIPAPDKRAAKETADGIIRDLRDRGLAVLNEAQLERGESADLLVVLGGDGSILRATRRFPDIPILGVNFGRVGFLAVVEQKDWRHAIERILVGDCVLRNEPTLDVSVIRSGGTPTEMGWVVNDVVLRSRGPLVYTELYLNHRFLNVYPGDGMIVSTALGSTGYSMAADGPVLLNVHALAVTPICCHSPLRVTLVVPDTSEIDLVVARGKDGVLWLDGVESSMLNEGDTVEVRRGKHTFQLVMFSESTHVDAFASKFEYQIRRGWQPTRSG